MIDKQMLNYLQIKDKKGKRLSVGTTSEFPKTATEYSTFSVDLKEEVYTIDKKGKFNKVIGFNSSWSEDLALAIFSKTEFNLKESIVISAKSCERCMNSLANEYGLHWGYPKYSTDWKRCGTECEFCEDENFDSISLECELKPAKEKKSKKGNK